MITGLRYIFCLGFLFSDHLAVLSQNTFFEGSVTYVHEESDQGGNKTSTPVTKERVFFSKNIILREDVSGPALQIIGNIKVYLNSEKGLRYFIDDDRKTIKNVGTPKSSAIIRPIEEKWVGEEEICGYKCDVHTLKYVNQFELPQGTVIDTLSCTYYNSKILKIFRPEIFGRLQGNKNTLILDGRYNGVPLKIILKRQDGSMIIIKSDEIKPMDVNEFVKLPNYDFKE